MTKFSIQHCKQLNKDSTHAKMRKWEKERKWEESLLFNVYSLLLTVNIVTEPISNSNMLVERLSLWHTLKLYQTVDCNQVVSISWHNGLNKFNWITLTL